MCCRLARISNCAPWSRMYLSHPPSLAHVKSHLSTKFREVLTAESSPCGWNCGGGNRIACFLCKILYIESRITCRFPSDINWPAHCNSEVIRESNVLKVHTWNNTFYWFTRLNFEQWTHASCTYRCTFQLNTICCRLTRISKCAFVFIQQPVSKNVMWTRVGIVSRATSLHFLLGKRLLNAIRVDTQSY